MAAMSSVGRVDLHSHLLPGVDDGCPTLDDSIACARAFVAAGYTHLCCTPHVWPSFPHNNQTQISTAVAELQQQYREADVALTLIPGGEMNLRPETIALTHEQIVTYGSANRYLLIDLWADKIPDFFEPAIDHLQSFGVKIILAHPERMKAVQDDPMLAEFFLERGLLLQGNLQCFADPPRSGTRTTAERLLSEGRYHVLGSDTHTAATLPIRLEGLQQVRRLVGDAMLDEMTIHRPREIAML
jgi:protein-tyrosine phosphatase